MGLKERDFPNKKEYDGAYDIEFSILVPSTRDKSIKISPKAFEKRIDDTVKWLTKIFGGTTIDVESGTYQLKGKTIKEPVALVTIYTNKSIYNKYDELIEKFLRDKKKTWGQDSMGYVYQGRMIFI